jgi:tetratricopeptide (TPR) repeat protein
MARDGLFSLVLSVGVVLTLGAATAAPPDDDARLRAQLAVQTALQQGRDCLQRGDYQGAVYCLEREIARVNGSRDYLNALREAYRGYARELLAANKGDEARIYLRRLQILDPGAHLDTPVVQEESTPLPRKIAGPAIRGQKPDSEPSDPFASTNHAADDSARTLIDRAAEEFSRKQYLVAGRLYQQAYDLDPGAAAASREQWAYCRLYTVADAINRSTGTSADLDAEVRRVLDMTASDKLQAFGKDLLRRLQERGSADVAVEVKHTPAQGERWAEAESANFRIIHRQSQEFAEKVVRIAEATRVKASKKWFGDVPPAWTPKCVVYLHADGAEYSRLTGAPPKSPGHSTMPAEGQRGMLRRIDLRCDATHMLEGVLPHETTHIVLFGRFGSKHIPRWADEGMAVHSEPRELIELHLRNLPRHAQERKLFSMAELVRMPDYPESGLIGPFYAQSVSLVDYLSAQRGGCQVLAQFVRDGMESGWEEALKRHYGIESFAELDRRWNDHAFSSANVSGKWR